MKTSNNYNHQHPDKVQPIVKHYKYSDNWSTTEFGFAESPIFSELWSLVRDMQKQSTRKFSSTLDFVINSRKGNSRAYSKSIGTS